MREPGLVARWRASVRVREPTGLPLRQRGTGHEIDSDDEAGEDLPGESHGRPRDPVELKITFCNSSYADNWYKMMRRQTPRHFRILEALLEEIETKDGGEISKSDLFKRRPEIATEVERLKFDLIPSRGQMLRHNGNGIRHAKFAPSKSIAVVWEKIGNTINVTFDDHAPIRYHRAIRHLRDLRIGKLPSLIRSRLAERSIRSSQARVATLDNWCGWIASGLPGISKFVPTFTAADYRRARTGALPPQSGVGCYAPSSYAKGFGGQGAPSRCASRPIRVTSPHAKQCHRARLVRSRTKFGLSRHKRFPPRKSGSPRFIPRSRIFHLIAPLSVADRRCRDERRPACFNPTPPARVKQKAYARCQPPNLPQSCATTASRSLSTANELLAIIRSA
jgi:hypothetical protein